MNLEAQQGFTLVELLVAAAISSIVATGLGAALHQFLVISERTGDMRKALHDVQNAGYWLVLDGKRAETTGLVDQDPPAEGITWSWISEEQAHTSRYFLSGRKLKRDHNGTVTTVAHHVSAIGFSLNGEMIEISMRSTPQGRWSISKESTFQIWLRPSG